MNKGKIEDNFNESLLTLDILDRNKLLVHQYNLRNHWFDRRNGFSRRNVRFYKWLHDCCTFAFFVLRTIPPLHHSHRDNAQRHHTPASRANKPRMDIYDHDIVAIHRTADTQVFLKHRLVVWIRVWRGVNRLSYFVQGCFWDSTIFSYQSHLGVGSVSGSRLGRRIVCRGCRWRPSCDRNLLETRNLIRCDKARIQDGICNLENGNKRIGMHFDDWM